MNKKIEDTEKRSRQEFSARTENLYWEIEDSIDRSENPESGRMNMELDELYSFGLPQGLYDS